MGLKFWSCRDVSRLIAEGGLEDASLARRALARLHLLGCRFCRRYLRELRLLAKGARAWSASLLEPGSTSAFEERLIARLAGSK